MAAELKDEFESYIRQLTTVICKDIFLEKLEQLSVQYDETYEKYEAEAERLASVSASVRTEIQAADQYVKKTEKNMRAMLESIAKELNEMEKDAGVITTEDLSQLQVSMQEHTAKLQEAVNALVSKQVQVLSNALDKQTAVFVKYVAKLLQKQFQETAAVLEKSVAQIEKKNESSILYLKETFAEYIKKQTVIEQKRQEELQAKEAEQKKINRYREIYMVVNNVIALSLFSISVFMQNSWEVWNQKEMILAGAVFCVAMVLMFVLNRIKK